MPATIDDVANIKEIEEVSGEWVKKRLEDMKKQHEEELNKLNKWPNIPNQSFFIYPPISLFLGSNFQ